jgi:hypothetical protein
MKSRKSRHPHFKERSFGISVGSVLLLIAAYMIVGAEQLRLGIWHGRITAPEITAGIGAVLLILGLTKPLLLKWPSAVWWKFAMVLGYVNARVILTMAFAIVFVPLGVTWRLIGRDPLATRRASFPGWTAYPARYRSRDHFTKMY